MPSLVIILGMSVIKYLKQSRSKDRALRDTCMNIERSRRVTVQYLFRFESNGWIIPKYNHPSCEQVHYVKLCQMSLGFQKQQPELHYYLSLDKLFYQYPFTHRNLKQRIKNSVCLKDDDARWGCLAILGLIRYSRTRRLIGQ